MNEIKNMNELDEAIAIILEAMNKIEVEHSETWYLPYLKLQNTFHHLCDVKYRLD